MGLAEAFSGHVDNTSHYHEAAYDAHMTGVAFMHILKFKEIEYLKNLQRVKAKKGKQKKKGEESKD